MLLGLDAEFVALSPAEKVWLLRLENINLNLILCVIFADAEFDIQKFVLLGNP